MIRPALLVLALLPAPALACAVAEPFTVADIAEGPIVVVGDVTAYHRDGLNEGRFVFRVSEVLAGAAPDEMEGYWPLIMAEFPPEAWDRPGPVVAAFYPSENGGPFRLAVEMCGKAWIAEATPENLATVKAALK